MDRKPTWKNASARALKMRDKENSAAGQSFCKKFYKRTCSQFVSREDNRKRCFCGLLDNEHEREDSLKDVSSSGVEWDPLEHTVAEPTDSYGQIEFSGAGQTSRAKYIRIAHDTDPETVLDFILNEWKLKLPKLLISVTGGAKSFKLHPRLKKVLRQGLLRAAQTTGAWIITGGTNTGVMKHVGEAVRGQTVISYPLLMSSPLMDDKITYQRSQLNLLGIASWGIVQHKNTLKNNGNTVTYHMTSSMASKGACLDNNHTHFILVDNGTTGKYGVEISFRASLENAISKRKISHKSTLGIPVVLLVLEGGPNTIRTVLESVTRSQAVPVVIAEGSGCAADIIAFAFKFTCENDGSEISDFKDVVEHRQLQHKIKIAYPHLSDDKVLATYKDVLKCVENKRLITIFRVDEEGVDIDRAILKALLKAEQASAADQLKLALVWNRPDFAKTEIFIEDNKWKEKELDEAMLYALANNRVEFVNLLLENGVSMEYFLTEDKLLSLYKERSRGNIAFKHIMQGKSFELKDIDDVIDEMLGGQRKILTNYYRKLSAIMTKPIHESLPDFQHPFHELFLWAVLCNMQKMALFMWERGDNNLMRALVGAKLYTEMAGRLKNDDVRDDVHKKLTANAKEFKDVALGLLNECFRVSELDTKKLLTYDVKDWCGHTCLSLAVTTQHEEFIAHGSCQSLLTEIWLGAMRNMDFPSLKIILGIMVPPTIYLLDFKTIRELSLLPVTFAKHQQDKAHTFSDKSQCVEEEEEVQSFDNTGNEEKVELRHRSIFYDKPSGEMSLLEYSLRKKLSSRRKLQEFFRAPITKFWFNVILYIIFLFLFSYVILVSDHRYPIVADVILIVFICSLCTEEIRQISQADVSASNNRLIAWASSKWNICDGLAVVFFFVGLGLTFSKSFASIGHVVYSLDIMLWIIRLLDIFSVSKHLGPYVVMIGRMTVDMLYFLLIMVVFLLAYGVAQQAILFPRERGSWGLISKIFFRPYFQIYGELFITDPIQLTVNSSTTEFETPKYDEYSGTIATIIMAFYLLVANILLLNLLIAIFNHTFSEIRANANQIWKFQRYQLYMEYVQRPVLPPPFVIVCHVFELMSFVYNKLCCCRKRKQEKPGQQEVRFNDNRLKLFLDKHEQEQLLMFEEHCLYLYLHHKDTLLNATSEERVRVIGNRVEYLTTKLDEISKESISHDTNGSMSALNAKVVSLEQSVTTIKNILNSLQQDIKSKDNP